MRLPQYLIFHIKRFTKNNWAKEKNPTIVNFPIKNIDMADCMFFVLIFIVFVLLLYLAHGFHIHCNCAHTVVESPESEQFGTHYDLLANICHEGKPGPGNGSYKVHVRDRATEQWYQIQDLIVEEIMPQMIFLSESYVQVGLGKEEDAVVGFFFISFRAFFFFILLILDLRRCVDLGAQAGVMMVAAGRNEQRDFREYRYFVPHTNDISTWCNKLVP